MNSSPKNDNSIIIYSPSCCSKPVDGNYSHWLHRKKPTR